MTYTFKLARRLAVSRNLSMLPVLLLFAGCAGGDATSPDNSPNDVPGSGIYAWRPRESTPVVLLVSPSSVIAETNQLLQFRARGRNRAGDEVVAPVTWSTTGGTILPDGRFSAASVGMYQVSGRTRTREGKEMVQTSTINVVRRQPKLKSIVVTPSSMTMNPGVTQTFAAIGRLAGGDTVPIGVTWSAKGGTIDAGGLFVAGDSAGTFKVIAVKNASTMADTATITISAPPPPPPSDSVPTPPIIPVEPAPPAPDTTPTLPPPPPPPPAPVLAQVALLPGSVTLAPGTNRQFSAYGRTTAGDSIGVTAVFSATGGTVTAGGLFTAGSSAGSFRVIASVGGLADTSTVTVTQPLGSGSGFSGIAFGPYHVPLDSLGRPNFYYSGGTRNGVPATLLSDLSKVRAARSRVAISLLRLKTQDATGKLSVATTQAYIATWPDISSYLADGTVVGVIVADDITWPDAWGGERPPLARVDSIALLVKNRWPNAVTMVRATPTQLVGRTWRWLETGWAQYDGPYRSGPPATYRANQTASAKALRLGLVLSLNVLNGGCGPVELGACMPEAPGTSILGTFADAGSVRRYQMSAAEVLHYGRIFLAEPYNCAFIQWQWSPIWTAARPLEQLLGVQAFDTRSDVRAAMTELSSIARQHPSTSCLQR